MILRLLVAIGLLLAVGVDAQPLPDVDPSARPPLLTAPPEGPPPEPEPHLWDGNQTSIMAGAALNFLDHAPTNISSLGTGFRLAGRVGVIAQFVDAEIGLEHVTHAGTGGAGLTRSELGFQFGTHPGFPTIVFNDWFYDVFSGFHGYVGASLMRMTLTGTEALGQAHVTQGTEHAEWQPNIYVGAGADIPISPRNKGWGIWLTARYNLRWSWFGPKQPEMSTSDNQALILLSFRSNSTSWMRIPKPF